jgi:hypothetical protein
MNRTKAAIALALSAAASVVIATSPASAFFNGREYRGGFVKPCSLDGVNPVYHPDIFGNPAFARDVFGFVQARDGRWYVMPNCRLY